ncbi:MAG: 30S ribosomal protein S6 [Planctomycetota bacterium]
MLLLDNDVVRQGYEQAKSVVTDTLQKYGANVHACRRWDERRLAYPINRKNRATYFLSYFEMPGDNIPGLRRELEFNERVLRYMLLAVDGLPEGEADQAKVEESAEFSVPAPPEDDAIELVEAPSAEVDEDVDDDEFLMPSDDKED